MTDSYVCIDLETTGLNPKTDKIMEIGAVKVEKGVEVQCYQTFINPGRKPEERVLELTGINLSDLEGAPYIEDVLAELLDFLGDSVLVGHRIIFDYSFLKKAALDQKLEFQKSGLDTLRMARVYLPDVEKKTLEYLCNYFEIPHRAHRALDDARATSRLYQILLEKFYQDTEVLFRPEPLICNIKRDTPATRAQKEQLARLVAQHGLELQADMEKMSRSEASRTIDKILLKFGRLQTDL